jgi:methionyl-tRNA synthetase
VAGLNLPKRVQIHGFLTVNGEKMSKSKGTFVLARTYLEHLDPAYLRYYYASKQGPKPDDLDLNLEEFVLKVNSDLVGKVVNLASRTARFVKDSGLSARYPDDGGLFQEAARRGEEIAQAYEGADFARAMRLVMALADRANEYVDRAEPWKLAKDPARAAELADVCTVVLNLYRQIVVYLAPVLPRLVEQTGELLNQPIERWQDAEQPLLGNKVREFRHLMQRVDPKKLEAMIAESLDASADVARAAGGANGDDGAAIAKEPIAAECTIDDFTRVDLRVARVLAAEEVAGAKKLLKLTLGLGGGTTRTVFAGIKGAYEPSALVGRLLICVANLAPRKMKFGTSEGMVVAAGSDDGVFLLGPDSGAKPGQRVH